MVHKNLKASIKNNLKKTVDFSSLKIVISESVVNSSKAFFGQHESVTVTTFCSVWVTPLHSVDWAEARFFLRQSRNRSSIAK